MTPPDSVFHDAAPAWIYDGTVMHARLKPFGHRFSYRVWSLLVDIDRVAEATANVALMSHNRFNLVAFHDADHGPGLAAERVPAHACRGAIPPLLAGEGPERSEGGGVLPLANDAEPYPALRATLPLQGRDDGGARREAHVKPLRAHVDRLLAAVGRPAPARVFLLCYPRVLGYTFNPISVYYCYDAGGRISALIYEVRNTFGERHTYLAPVAPGEASPAGIRQERAKIFFVSPFLDLSLTYRFRVNPPGEALTLRILEVDGGGAPVLAATFSARRLALTSGNLLSVSLTAPLLGLKVLAGIHWEALKIWLKGGRLQSRPRPPAPVSVGEPPRFIDAGAPKPAISAPP